MKKDQLNQNLVDYITGSMSSKVVTIIIVIHPKKNKFSKKLTGGAKKKTLNLKASAEMYYSFLLDLSKINIGVCYL